MQNQQIPKVWTKPTKSVKIAQVFDQRVGQQKPPGQELQQPQLKVDQPIVQTGSSASIIPRYNIFIGRNAGVFFCGL